MWIITAQGFYSIVKKAGDPPGMLTIRARVKNDLLNLQSKLPSMSSIVESDDSDYRYRAFAKPEDVAQAVSDMIMKIDYPNFKNKVSDGNLYRGAVYSSVWGELMRIEHEEA